MNNNKHSLYRMAWLASPAGLVLLTTACVTGLPSGSVPGDSVAVVFTNDSQYEVDPTVDGERMETVLPGRTTRPVLFDCRAGRHLEFSGSMRTNTKTLPSPYYVTFDEGTNFGCGGTIEMKYYLNNENNLDLDGASY